MIGALDYNSLKNLRNSTPDLFIYATQVYEAVSIINEIYCKQKLNASFVNNLKDSMIHFNKFDNALRKEDENVLDIYTQYEFMSEHLTRGIIDAYVEVLQEASIFYETFLNCLITEKELGRLTDVDPYIKMIRESMHYAKDNILELRSKKYELFRIIDCSSGEIKYIFTARSKEINRQITSRHKKIKEFGFYSPVIKELYLIAQEACINGHNLCRVKNGDTPESIALKYNSDARMIIKINRLGKSLINAKFPSNVYWIFYS